MLKSIVFKFFVLVIFSTFLGCSKEKTTIEDDEKETIIIVNDIRFESQSGKVIIGSKVQLTVKIFPENATNKKVKWESNNHNVATVDKDGMITTYRKGEAEITATSESSNKSAVYKIEVSLLGVNEIITNNNNYTVMVGDKEPINVTINPDKPENPKLILESSNIQIASIGEDGVISGIAKGTAEIKIISQSNPDVFKIVTVLVIESPHELIDMKLQDAHYKNINDYITGTCGLGINMSSHFIRNVDKIEISLIDGHNTIIKKTNLEELPPRGAISVNNSLTFDNTYKPYFSVKYTYRGKEYIKTLKIN